MPNKHQRPPVQFRPPAELRERLAAFQLDDGRSVGAILSAALDAYLPPPLVDEPEPRRLALVADEPEPAEAVDQRKGPRHARPSHRDVFHTRS